MTAVQRAEAQVVTAAMVYAELHRKMRTTDKWWQDRDEAEAVLFTRCARLERVRKGAKR